MRNIILKEKVIEFSPVKNDYFVKFIPINCEIEIKSEDNKNLETKLYEIGDGLIVAKVLN